MDKHAASIMVSLFPNDSETTAVRVQEHTNWTVDIGAYPVRVTVYIDSESKAREIAQAFLKAADGLKETADLKAAMKAEVSL